jgi:hypothetical protein
MQRADSSGLGSRLFGGRHFSTLPVQTPQDRVQQLAGAAHKRLALRVFIGARRFAHHQQVGLPVADTKHRLGACLVQAAQGAGPHGGGEFVPGRRSRGRCHGHGQPRCRALARQPPSRQPQIDAQRIQIGLRLHHFADGADRAARRSLRHTQATGADSA